MYYICLRLCVCVCMLEYMTDTEMRSELTAQSHTYHIARCVSIALDMVINQANCWVNLLAAHTNGQYIHIRVCNTEIVLRSATVIETSIIMIHHTEDEGGFEDASMRSVDDDWYLGMLLVLTIRFVLPPQLGECGTELQICCGETTQTA